MVNNRFVRCSGKEIPPHATVVYDILLVDLHNPKDDISVEVREIPEPCTRKSIAGDYVRYHYNGTFLDGATFDSRSAHGFLSLTWRNRPAFISNSRCYE